MFLSTLCALVRRGVAGFGGIAFEWGKGFGSLGLWLGCSDGLGVILEPALLTAGPGGHCLHVRDLALLSRQGCPLESWHECCGVSRRSEGGQ